MSTTTHNVNTTGWDTARDGTNVVVLRDVMNTNQADSQSAPTTFIGVMISHTSTACCYLGLLQLDVLLLHFLHTYNVSRAFTNICWRHTTST